MTVYIQDFINYVTLRIERIGNDATLKVDTER